MFKNMVDSGYFMFMAEKEGFDNLVNTRTAKVNAIIKDFKYIISSGENPNDYIDDVFNRHNLTIEELTETEVEKINNLI